MDLNFLAEKLKGCSVQKPISGTLSGHAAGEPFDKEVERILKDYAAPDMVYRQYEYLNLLFERNPSKKSFDERSALIGSKVARNLLFRGKQPTTDWSIDKQFEEKQNDTADLLIAQTEISSALPTFHILDVKTTNIDKYGQPPNIISSQKVANMCAEMLKTEDFSSLNISYIGIYWRLKKVKDEELLVCERACVKNLFKVKPQDLYINFTAAQQIQFHCEDLGQDCELSVKEWCSDYLAHYCERRVAHVSKQLDKLKDYEPYLEMKIPKLEA